MKAPIIRVQVNSAFYPFEFLFLFGSFLLVVIGHYSAAVVLLLALFPFILLGMLLVICDLIARWQS